MRIRFNDIADTEMWECDECKALVWFDSTDGHDKWHEQQKETQRLANSLRPLA